ncbi:putative transporter [Yarrowia sp. C11]|nr:putative transporter [Yarrowia sp. E02]KAG5373550.1 putative transporter [Yarrowia sp. C11]
MADKKFDQVSISVDSISDTDTAPVSIIDGSGTGGNIFSNPEVAKHFAKLNEDAKYENRHLFDPQLEWTPQEEKKLVRKLDWYVTTWTCIMFVALQVDRGNLGQALTDNLLDDLGMTTNDYNKGNTIFLCSFLAAEIPSQLISKKIGPDRWVPAQMVLWSIVAAAQGGLTGKGSFYATRCLLGLLEGGFIPDLVLWLSYFYTSKELPFRLSLFWGSQTLTTILTSLLAFGLLRIHTSSIPHGWRWLFIIEGIMTLLIGLASFFKMPASPSQTKTWFRKNGWFTEREEKIVVNRVLRDDPYKGDLHNREGLSLNRIWNAFADYRLWPIYAAGMFSQIATNAVSFYMTLNLRGLGFSTFNTNLLTIPAGVLHIIMMISITLSSEFFNERSFHCMAHPIWMLPGLMVLRFWKGALVDKWGTWAVMTLILGQPQNHAILVSWTSRNSNTVSQRTMGQSLYNMFVQVGAIVGANIYRADDKPKYHRGNQQLIILYFVLIVILGGTKLFYYLINKRRSEKWNAMTKEEQQHYRDTNKDSGSKRLDFRLAL